jgi:hypothetical protein
MLTAAPLTAACCPGQGRFRIAAKLEMQNAIQAAGAKGRQPESAHSQDVLVEPGQTLLGLLPAPRIRALIWSAKGTLAEALKSCQEEIMIFYTKY